MELQFQKPQSHAQQQQYFHCQVPVAKETNKPSRERSKYGSGGKFVGVRRRASGRWVAEIKDTTQKIRVWLGTFETAEEAARAYDEAACLLRGANTRTNFAAAGAQDSPVASRIRTLLNHKRLKKKGFSPTAYHHGGTGSVTATAATSTSTSTITTTSSVSPSSSAASSTINFAMSGCGVRTPILPAHNVVTEDEAYRPYLISGSDDDFQLASQQYEEQPWALNTSLPPTEGRDNACSAMTELEEINLEKGSPRPAASSQGMDRVVQDQDLDDTGNGDPSDSLWDLPPIYPLSCRSLMY